MTKKTHLRTVWIVGIVLAIARYVRAVQQSHGITDQPHKI